MDSADHRLTCELDYGTSSETRIVADAIGQEVGEIDDERSTTRLERTDRSIRLHIEATDLVALRAATNTWLSLVDVAERVFDPNPPGDS